MRGIGGLTGALGGGATYMQPADYETSAGLDLDLSTDPGTALGAGDVDVPSILSPFEWPEETLTFDPTTLPPAPALAPGTWVNIAIGIAIGIVIDRVFLK